MSFFTHARMISLDIYTNTVAADGDGGQLAKLA